MISLLKRLFRRTEEPARPPREIHELMRPLAAPAIHITRSDTPSRSHFGGIADLPAGLAWPEYKGSALSLLAHLSLPDLHAAYPIEWLPTNGSLLFFYDVDRQPWGYDPHDRGSARVLHIPDPTAPLSDAGNRAKKGTPTLPRQDVAFRNIQVFPADRPCVTALDLSDQESDAFCGTADAAFGNKPHHQIAGHPGPIQTDDMELECHLVTNGLYLGDSRRDDSTRTEELRSRADRWVLLLQLDTDDKLEFIWGDCGRIYFWVEKEAARAGDFSNVWLILQCT